MKKINWVEVKKKHDKKDKIIPFYSPKATNCFKQYINDLGMVLIFKPKHPHSGKNGYVFQEILVMEEKLKRQLTPKEALSVFHVNSNLSDNRPENLYLKKSKEVKNSQ